MDPAPQPFNERVRCYLRRLVGLWWTLMASVWLLLGYRPVEQQEITTSDSGPEDESALPEEFRVLQSGLMEYYKSLLTLPTGVRSASDQSDIDEIYVEPHLVRVDHHTAQTKEKAKEKEEKISLVDVFLHNKKGRRNIYVSGDAGKGKTSLCKRIISDWCSVHSQDQPTDSPVSNVKQFDFLFYISLRHANKHYDINEMIVSQLLYKNPHIKQAKSTDKKAVDFLDEVLEQYSERCLIILDGLDEWSAPRESDYPTVSDGVPGRNPHLKYTMLTTTRPWKLEVLRLESTEIDCQIDIRGLQSVDDFGRKLMNAYNKRENKQKEYRKFYLKLQQTGLEKMKNTPILLKQLIGLWHNDQPFGKSKTMIYTNMVELLFELAEKRKYFTQSHMQIEHNKLGTIATPTCLENVQRCKRHTCLLLKVGKLAFETLFCADKETQLAFESTEAEKIDLDESDIKLCLAVGILTQSILPDMTRERKSISFLHKSFHEYFAALYLSMVGGRISYLKTRISSKCKTLDTLFDMEDLFLFLSGMCPSLMNDCSTCIVDAINSDKKIQKTGLSPFPLDFIFHRIQSMILRCCKESSVNGHDPLYLPIPDVFSSNLSHTDCHTLTLCMQKYPSELRSYGWHKNDDTVLAQILPGITSVKQLNDDNHEDTRSAKYYLDLSNYHNLSYFTEEGPCDIPVKVNEQQLVYLNLSYLSSPSVLSTIRNARKLKTLILRFVQLTDYAAGSQPTFNLDLSGHSDLTALDIGDLSATSVTLSSSIKSITMRNINILTHDGMYSLMSNISRAHSIESITLESVMCGNQGRGEGCGYMIDLSRCSKLRSLHVGDISPGSVTLSPSISYIAMRNIHTLTHTDICSLMSGISHAQSLEDLNLKSVKCGDHASGEGCGYMIDLSGCSKLRSLHVDDISPGSVTLSPSISDIKMRNIHTLTHTDICSLMASISHAQSLEHINLKSVKCCDHASGEGCGYMMDLSECSKLRSLHVDDISPGSVTLSPSISDIKMRNIHTLTHTDICSLMAGISHAQSLEQINLKSVKCGDHASGEGCRYEIDLSGCSELRKLDVDDISPGSVTLSPSISDIKMRNIHTLTHTDICSLMSGISHAQSLEQINLESVKCGDHASGEGCRYEIDLSGCSELRKLDVDDISPGSVTLSPSISDIKMRNIHTLTHTDICSLMSGISHAQSLEHIKLKSVNCGDHASGEGCGYEIDLSGCSELMWLDVGDISPGSVTLSPSISDIKMRNINTLTHTGICSLMSNISHAQSLCTITLDSVKCADHASGEGCGYMIDLSGCSELRGLHVEYISPGSVTLSPSISDIKMKSIHTLTHTDICSLMAGISDAQSLCRITLDSVKCSDHASGEGCGYMIDLSGCSELRKLDVGDISPGSVTLSPSISTIKMRNIHTLSHTGICSLVSGISHAQSLEYINLKSVKCGDHASGEGCGYMIDLSGCSELRTLDVKDISPGSVTLSPSISDIKMRNIYTLSHTDICSLVSSISHAQSLEYINLKSVKCGDHASGEGCGYIIDLSRCSKLRRLDVEDISPGSVTLSPSISDIKMRNIHTLSHTDICSLVSSISHAQSLEYINLKSVKCGDHASGEGCGYEIDLSGCSKLGCLDVGDISPGSVTLSPSISNIKMRNIDTLTHTGICSLMSGISHAQSLHGITLDSVKCADHASGEGCGYMIDLSGCSKLSWLDVGDISPGSVTLSPSISHIGMRNIDTLTHTGICSLMSGLSHAHSLCRITLDSVKCGDHASEEGCGYMIDLSGCSELRTLDVKDISPGSVTLSPSISDIKMRNIYTLSHTDICSLVSSISHAQSLEYINLKSVKCGDHASGEGCGYIIDLSGCSELRTLDVKDISPGSVTLSPSISDIKMRNIYTLSHTDICSLVSSISHAQSLEYINLKSVKCGDHASGEGCGYEIDLSGCSELMWLDVGDISPGSVTLSPSISHIKMRNIDTLTHTGICSLMSGISHAQSLHDITLHSVKCGDHASGEGCGYMIDLSGCSELRWLDVGDISPGSVTLSPSISDIEMRNIDTLTHTGICSLMSGLSHAHSLCHITLDSVKCGDHASEEGCGYMIDLSGCSILRKLDVGDISPGSVTLSPSISDIKMRNIHTLTHTGICSLMSSISHAQSLCTITLDSVKCGDHASGEGCGYMIDLSGCSELWQLYVGDISPGSVTLSPSIWDIKMRNIHTLTHTDICSLMSSISHAQSLGVITLDSVKCGDHANGEGCGYMIDLSGCSILRKLDVGDISPGSVTLSPSISHIKMRNIDTLTHTGICSLMSGISHAQSLFDITLHSVKCGDHASGEGCGYMIDLSGCSELRKLDVGDISPGYVTLSPSISRLVMRNIETLSHDCIDSLVSSISNATPRVEIYIKSITCIDYVSGNRCGNVIRQLQR